MTRENIEGMIRTALVTHHAKYGVMLPKVDEFIDHLANAMEAQQKREADAVKSVNRGANDADMPGIDKL